MPVILIADDEKNIRAGIRKILAESLNSGVEYREAKNGEEALELIRGGGIDLLITDIRMPKMDGIELMRSVRAEGNEDLGIIVLSGYDEFSYAQKAITFKVSSYIVKPVDKAELVSAALKTLEESGEWKRRNLEKAPAEIPALTGGWKQPRKGQIRHAFIDHALEWINEHFTEDINMAMAANQVSVNYTYFSEKFKEHTGVNFSEYLKRLRIDAAIRLLETGNYRVSEVAARSGYSDVKYFIKSFKEITGLSPGAYRQKT